jgi:long-chain acyl-CoA synthetase
MKGLLTPARMVLHRAETTPNQPYLHQPVHGAWRMYTWGEVVDQSRRMATALRALGLAEGSRIGITGMNTAHWFMAEIASSLGGYVSVGLYPKQSPDAVSYIANHSGMKAVFVGPMPDAKSMLDALPADIIRIALPYPGVAEQQYSWDALVAGHEPLEQPVERDPDAPLTLIYTSGTTGNPKGVIITMDNMLFAIQGTLRDMPARPGGEHLLSYLPLAHAFERGAVFAGSMYLQCEVYFLESADKLQETLLRVRPTRFFGVPLVWTRMQNGILGKMPQEKLDRMLSIPLVSTYLRHKLRKNLGLDRCWLRISGAAPMPLPVLEWFQKVGLEIFQGYGMTENTIYVSCNMPGNNRLGSVGHPYVDSLVRISPEGEIQNKHPGVTKGYYKDPEKTAELFTEDGWLRTGDVGRIDEDGYLYVTGRMKEIFKTLKGKYVTPAPIEGAFLRNTDIDQLCLVGAGLRQPIMLVSLNPSAKSKPRETLEKELVATMEQVDTGLEDHEKVAKIIVTREPWSIDNNLLTPTMKVRRNQVEQRYNAIIQANENRRDVKVIWE